MVYKGIVQYQKKRNNSLSAFIKNCGKTKGMSGLFLFLSVLNFFDGLVTLLGVHNGIIDEYNPLMAVLLYEHPFLFLMIKIGLSLFLLFLEQYLKGRRVSSILKALTLAALGLYVFVTFTHFVWLFLLT